MKLKHLTGKHILDAVDFDKYDDCTVCRFRLDGIIYEAVEDQEDGWRSCMEELKAHALRIMVNVFPPVEVIGMYISECCEILNLIDVVTGKIVLSVGTENTDDWHPYYVARFDPTAMSTNT